MPESYREYPEGAAAEDSRTQRLRAERDALRLQMAKLQIDEIKHQIAMLRDQSPATEKTEAGLLDEDLQTETEPVEASGQSGNVSARNARRS